jgi:hypothetical protein
LRKIQTRLRRGGKAAGLLQLPLLGFEPPCRLVGWRKKRVIETGKKLYSSYLEWRTSNALEND